MPEVSFAYAGERGVIDIVAWHAAAQTMLIVALKTQIVDINNLMATMDIRARMARRIARDRGWTPSTIGLWVVVAPGRTNEQILAEHATVLRAKFPHDGRVIRSWLARPSGAISALSFLPQVRMGNVRRDATTPRRVRRTSTSVAGGQEPDAPRPQPRIGVAFRV